MIEYCQILRFGALVLALPLLSACADNPTRTAVTTPSSAPPAVADPAQPPTPADTATKAVAPSAPPEPPAPPFQFHSQAEERLYRDGLYQVLLAEMAGYRGYYTLSAQYYFEVAKQIRKPAVAERAAQIALYAKEYDLALSAAKLWAQLDPRSADARQVLIAMLLRKGDKDSAFAEMELMLDNLSEVSDERLETLIKLLRSSENHATALKIIDKILAKRPEDVDIQLIQARLLIGTRQWEASERALLDILERDPERDEALELYLQVLHQQDKSAEALAWLRQRVEQDPEATSWRLHYARQLLAAEQNEAALSEYERLLEQTPDDTEILYTLGLLYFQAERLDEAKTRLQALLKLADAEEQRNAARYFLGQIAGEQQQWNEAEAYYRKITHGSHYLGARARLALSLIEQQQFDSGLEILRDTRFQSPTERFKFLRLEADLLIEQARYIEAQKVLEDGLESYPDNADLLYALSLVAEKMQRDDLMEQYLREILKTQPHNADALNALGYTLADRSERYQEAYDLISKALEQKPNAHYILDSMGWVLYKLGRREEALDYLQRALQAEDDPEIAAHVGEVLWQLQRGDEAREVWEKALERFPGDAVLRRTMQRFLP